MNSDENTGDEVEQQETEHEEMDLAFGSQKPPPPYHLFSIFGIVLTSASVEFLGLSVALAINYWRAGHKATAVGTVLVGAVMMAALYVFKNSLPYEWYGYMTFVVVPPIVFASYHIATWLQAGMIRKHVWQGGGLIDWRWSIALSAVLFPANMLINVSVALPIRLWQNYQQLGTHLAYSQDEIYIAGEATQEDADRLAVDLKTLKVFGQNGASVRLNRANGVWEVSFIVPQKTFSDPNSDNEAREEGEKLAAGALSKPLVVHLCDHGFEMKRTVKIE
jgi:hypothetical protein